MGAGVIARRVEPPKVLDIVDRRGRQLRALCRKLTLRRCQMASGGNLMQVPALDRRG